jgi:dinuclear metal center YbgI/SA1388 family protein
MAKVLNLVQSFEKLWPLQLAEAWDTPGLLVGQGEASVGKVLLSVDLTFDVLDLAIQGGFDLILCHHPYLMRGVNTLSESTVKGGVVSQAIRAGVAVYAAHTNADSASNGVSDSLADAIGIIGALPMVESTDGQGLGRFGELVSPKSLGEIATVLARVLPATATGIRVAGDYHQMISSVGVCGGAGDSLLPEAKKLGLDLFVTADLRHHVAVSYTHLRAHETG